MIEYREEICAIYNQRQQMKTYTSNVSIYTLRCVQFNANF